MPAEIAGEVRKLLFLRKGLYSSYCGQWVLSLMTIFDCSPGFLNMSEKWLCLKICEQPHEGWLKEDLKRELNFFRLIAGMLFWLTRGNLKDTKKGDKNILTLAVAVVKFIVYLIVDLIFLIMFIIVFPVMLIVFILFVILIVILGILLACCLFYQPTYNPIYNVLAYFNFMGKVLQCQYCLKMDEESTA